MADVYSLVTFLCRLHGAVPRFLPTRRGWALPPLFLVLELTYRCNLRCGFCYLRHAGDAAPPDLATAELSPAELLALVEQTPPWTLILLSGGEIFVRDDILEILGPLARKRPCHIFTNGTLIDAGLAAELIRMGVASIGVSVDGPKTIHDRLRGEGTFAAATTAVQHLASARANRKRPLLNLKTTILPDNAGCLTDSVRLAEDLGADYCTFQILTTSLCLGARSLRETFEDGPIPPPVPDVPFDTLAGQLRAIRRMAAASSVRVRFLPDLPAALIADRYANRLDIDGFTCHSPWSVMYVSPFGDVYPCLNIRIGSARSQPLRALWNSDRHRGFRQRLTVCGLFPDCGGCCDLVLRGTSTRA